MSHDLSLKKSGKAIVLLSGGMDSAVVAAVAKEHHEEVLGLNIHYGQRHKVELECARKIAQVLGIKYEEIDLTDIFKNFTSTLLKHSKEDIDDNQDKNEIGGTYVPARNSIFLSIAAGFADSAGYDYVYYGAHKDDAGGYPDTTVNYFWSMKQALWDGTKNRVFIRAPFINEDKSVIVKVGMKLKVPFELTHSCYRGERPACGTCPTCKLRLEAFEKAGYQDPLKYKK